ncbi:hypothetical protein PHISP_04782 [Aspergillus sp. HF37]|nr:hypothetical protein PHISP_04782 [Aspergillus sp. HF37]
MCFYTHSRKKYKPIKEYEAALLQSLKPTANHTDTETFRRATKVLLLGPSGSGKSAIIRKLRMQSGMCIPDDDREKARFQILSQMHNALVASIAELECREELATSTSSVSDVVRGQPSNKPEMLV